MPKYIDAEQFLIDEAYFADRDFINPKYCDTLRDLIERTPAADVAPMKHGRWKFDPLAGDWICSECDLHSMEHGRFCPNCGAKNKEG